MKNSFTLLETIFSLAIITIALNGLFKLSTTQSKYDRYSDIQNAKNQLLSNPSQTSYSSDYIALTRKIVP